MCSSDLPIKHHEISMPQDVSNDSNISETALSSGLFSDQPPTTSNLQQDVQDSNVDHSMPFSVAKPGIKSAKKSTNKSKGLLGAVLGTDGSVTHEQSRML